MEPDDLMEDIFGEASEKKKEEETDDFFALGAGSPETGGSKDNGGSRRDSEFDDLFNSIGFEGSSSTMQSSSQRKSSSNSLDDVDAFISGLTGSGMPEKKHGEFDQGEDSSANLEKDEFLSWLEDSNSKSTEDKKTTKVRAAALEISPGAEDSGSSPGLGEDEEDDDEDHFYLDHSGVMVVERGRENESNGKDSSGNGSKEEKEIAKESILPFPSIRPILNVEDRRALMVSTRPFPLQNMIDSDSDSGDLASANAKVTNRVDTLFEIEQFDPQALRSAATIKGVAGFVLPSSLRTEIWSAVLGGSKLVTQATPEWFQVPDDRVEEIFTSVRRSIRRDCQGAWALLSGSPNLSEDDEIVTSLFELVCKFVLRNSSKAYNILLSNLVCISAWAVARSTQTSEKKSLDKIDLEKCAKLVEIISTKWGGRKGDWVNVGLQRDMTTNSKGVGGAAWTCDAFPLVAFRRHMVLTRLLAFHDPALSFHLETFCKGWSCAELTVVLQSKDVKPPLYDPDLADPAVVAFQGRVVERVIKMAEGTEWPCAKLFGTLSPMQGAEKRSDLTGDSLLVLWDTLVFSGKTPQSMSFFFVVAVLVYSRSALLESQDSAALWRIVDKGFEACVRQVDESRSVEKLASLALGFAEATPEPILKWVSEEELPLSLPSDRQLAEYNEKRIEAKQREQDLLKAEEEKARLQEEKTTVSSSGGTSFDQEDRGEDEHLAEELDEKLEFETPTKDGDGASGKKENTGGSKTGWFSSALKKRAQTIKSAILTASGGGTVDWSKYHIIRRLVEIQGDSQLPVGLSLRKGRLGLQIEHVHPNSPAANTRLICSGDLLMTMNGILVVGLSAADAEALLTMQEKPFYVVVATVLPKEVELPPETESLLHTPSSCPLLADRVEAYYYTHNKGKEKEVDKMLAIYANYESALLEELAQKYGDHVEGDPFYFPQSLFCPPMEAKSVVKEVCFKEGDHSPHADNFTKPGHSNGANMKNTALNRKLFVVDCRSPTTIQRTGRFATGFSLDPASLDIEEECEKLRGLFEPMKGDMQICILGSGNDALLTDLNPLRSRILRERDRRAIDTCVLYFLRLGFPLVTFVEGGFLSCFMAIRELGYSLDDCLINMPDNRETLNKYDAFIRYRKSPTTVSAAFLAQKARVGARTARSDTTASFSGLAAAEDEVYKGKNLAAIGSLLSNVWKRPPQEESGQHQTAPKSEQPNESSATRKEPISRQASAEVGKATAAASSFLSSVWKKSPPSEAAPPPPPVEQSSAAAASSRPTSSWTSGWSSRLKSLKVPDTAGLGEKLRSSVSQAYVSAQQKLAAYEQQQLQQREADADIAENPEVMLMVANLSKGAVVDLSELGNTARVFETVKEKRKSNSIENMEKESAEDVIGLLNRLLVITPDRFLVLERNSENPLLATVKSNRTLKQVSRMRYPNNDPSKISLFYNKDNDIQVSYIYRFPEKAKPFTKTIMRACSKYNAKHASPAPTPAPSENLPSSEGGV